MSDISAVKFSLPNAIDTPHTRPRIRRVPTAYSDLHALYQQLAPSNVRPPTPWAGDTIEVTHGPTVTMHTPSPEPTSPHAYPLPQNEERRLPRFIHHLDFSDTRTVHVITPNPRHPANRQIVG